MGVRWVSGVGYGEVMGCNGRDCGEGKRLQEEK